MIHILGVLALFAIIGGPGWFFYWIASGPREDH